VCDKLRRLNWTLYIIAFASASACLAGLISIGTAVAGRWLLTWRLGRAGCLGGLGAFVAAMIIVTARPLFGFEALSDASSKATLLAKAISDFMNVTALSVPAVMIGTVTWLVGRRGERRREHAGATATPG
jgi:hypothetical protein